MKYALFMIIVVTLGAAWANPGPALAGETPVQTYFVPLPEAQVGTFMLTQATSVTQMDSIISIVASANGTVIYYDHWEDGYEATLSSPVQATTRSWGDGLASTGCPPNKNGAALTCTDANDTLNAGDVVILRNNVPLPRVQANQLYDGRDKFGATKAVAVTRAQWDTTIGTVFASAVDVYDTSAYGTSFTMPAGENLTNDRDAFQTARLFVMASQDGTSCTFKGANFTLNQGEGYYYASTVNSGDTLTCSKPVQTDLASGDSLESPPYYEARWYSLPPNNLWSTGYYTPVGAPNSSYPAIVFVYNPSTTTSITVNWARSGATSSFTVAANTTYPYEITYNSGTSFTCSATCLAVEAVNIPTDVQLSANYDWGFTLMAQNQASDELLLGWGPGSSDLSVNGSPIWVTPVDSGTTTVYVDYDGDPTTGPNTDPNGNHYNISYNLSQWTSQRVFDSGDRDQTRMRIYTTDGKKIVAAYGEDASTAGASSPYMDLGTVIRPLPRILGGKSAELFTDNDGDGVPSPGDVLRYIIKIENRGSGSTSGLNLADTVPTNTTYNATSTQVSFNNGTSWSNVADGDSTAFPLDEGGYSFPNPPNTNGAGILAGSATYLVRFLVTIPDPTPPAATTEIKNSANWGSALGQVPVEVTTPLSVLDWGDLPDNTVGSYGFCTRLVNNGARHSHSGLYLGSATNFDRNTNGIPSVNADGDNANNTNDETGVNLRGTGADWGHGTGAFNVTVSGGNGCLNAWMDFTNDSGAGGTGAGQSFRDFNFTRTVGVYDQYTTGGTTYSEYILQNKLVSAGVNNFTFPVPSTLLGTSSMSYYLRFRLSPRDGSNGCSTTVTDCGLVQGGEVEDYMITFSPTAVTLASFTAAAQGSAVLVEWETAMELNNQGFNLYRSTSLDGEKIKLNEALIPSQNAGSTTGYQYSYTDSAGLVAGTTYYYWLEDVSLDNVATLHEPVTVTYTGPTAVRLSGLRAAGSLALAWPLTGVALLAVAAIALVRRRIR